MTNAVVRQETLANGESRLHMLETIREFALEQLAPRREEPALRTHHAAYYLQFAEAAHPKLDTGEQDVWLNQLEAEHGNLRAALAWAIEEEDATLAIRLAAALWRFWEIRGYFSEGRRWLTAALDQGQNAPATLRAVAYTGAGTMAFHQGDYSQATILHQHALDLYHGLDDTQGVAFALNNLGAQAHQQGDFATAIQHYTKSLMLSQQLGDTRLSAYTLFNMAEIAQYQGDTVRAEELVAQSLGMFRQLGDQWAICYTMVGLGNLAGQQGNAAQATAVYRDALRLGQERGYIDLVAKCFEGLASCAARQSDGRRAARLFGAAEELREQVDAPRPSMEQQWYNEITAYARATLDTTTYQAAWMEGRIMPLQDAIAYAMETDHS